MSTRFERIFPHVPWLVASAYALSGAAWIFFSDQILLSLSSSLGSYQALQTYKGWGFVAFSALLILFLMRLAWRRALVAYRTVAQNERHLNAALSSAGGGIWEIDLAASDGTPVRISPKISELLGLPPERVVTIEDLGKLRHPEDTGQPGLTLSQTVLAGGDQPFTARYRLRTGDGTYRWIQTSGNVLMSAAGTPESLMGVALDITTQVEAETALENVLRFDGVTGLLRQKPFIDHLDALMASAAADEVVAVVQFRLPDIASLAGDGENSHDSRFVRLVSDRMRACPKIHGARFASDVFALALKTPAASHTAQTDLTKCLDDIVGPVDLAGRSVKFRIQAGGALAARAESTAAELVNGSGRAMEQADRATRAEIRWCSPELRDAFARRNALVLGLQNAVRNGEIECHFQPIIDTRSARTWGFEALARWRRAPDELVAPGIFIPLAEEIGIIDEIGEAVLRQACLTARSWPEPHPVVAVNVSPLQLDDATYPATVARILAETGLPPGRLELEITESALAKSPDVALERLEALRDVGVQIGIDDFGTGYSSLSLLSRIPCTRLKIDRSFISDCAQPPCRHQAIRDMIISLAQSLDLALTAEGVETRAQAGMLVAKGVDCLQGFHFARPVPASQVAELVHRHWGAELAGTNDAEAAARGASR